MNQALQSDLHPDAESLNAFMEQALPKPERAQILDHMAACSQCRQIVFLSQQAAADADAPTAAPEAIRQVAWYRKRNLNWRIAWAPAAAFALIVVVTLLHYRPRPAGQTEMARNTPPAPIDSTAPSPSEPATQAKPRQTAPPVSLKSAKKSAASDALRELSEEPITATSYSGAVAGEIGTAGQPEAERPLTAPPPAAFAQGIPANAPAEPKPEPAVAAWQAQRHVADELSEVNKATRATETWYSAKGDSMRSSHGMVKAEAAAPVAMPSSSLGGGFEPSAPRVAPLAMAAPKPETVKLPSGLSPVSIATVRHRTVAVDPAGSLFVRESSSANWESVVRQWTGQVVQVRVQQPQSGSTLGISAAPSAAFQIVNDSNRVWVSQDGKTWKTQ